MNEMSELIKMINAIELTVPNRSLEYVEGYVNGYEVARNSIIAELKKHDTKRENP